MKTRKPLIPDDVRALYEELIAEGGRLLEEDDPAWQDNTVQELLQYGLGCVIHRRPPLLLPVGPQVAFACALARWVRTLETHKKRQGAAHDMAIMLQQVLVRAAASKGQDYGCSVLAGRHHVAALHTALTHSARTQVRSLATGPYGESQLLPNGEPHPLISGYLGQPPDFRADGGSYRTLWDKETIDTLPHYAILGYADGEDMWVVQEKLPMKLLIIDDHTALVPMGPYGHPCLLIRDPGLVTTFATLFELKWAQGEPWAPPGTPTPTRDDSQRQRIVDALAAGLKDEAIARQLGVSVRTVRRHITALMQQLGASTRFAAGVAAVRRGWVTRPT